MVLSCVGVMFAPHHQATADELTRVCRPGGTIGSAQLDPGGIPRSDARHDQAVRALSASGCPAASAVGQREPCAYVCSATESLTLRPAVTPSESIASTTPRHSASTSRPVMARRSWPTGASPRTRIGLMRWIATSPTSPDASTMAPTRRSWIGSTCYSPPTTAADRKLRRPGLRMSNMALRCSLPHTNDTGFVGTLNPSNLQDLLIQFATIPALRGGWPWRSFP